MSLQLESLKGIPISFATCSIGCKPDDKLQKKINALSAAGFKAIELAFPDIQQVASDHLRKEVQASDYDDLCTAARVIKAWLDAKGMKVMMIQPFTNFEGWPEGSQERKDVFSRAKGWIEIMKACGTDILQVVHPALLFLWSSQQAGRLVRHTLRKDWNGQESFRQRPARTLRSLEGTQPPGGLRELVLDTCF